MENEEERKDEERGRSEGTREEINPDPKDKVKGVPKVTTRKLNDLKKTEQLDIITLVTERDRERRK